MRKLLVVTLLAGSMLAVHPASAAVVISTAGITTDQNVLFVQNTTLSPTQIGFTNQTNTQVTFSNPLGLIAPTSGHAFVYNTTAGNETYLLGATTFALDPLNFFTGAEFNLPGVPGNPPPTEATSVLVEALGLGLNVIGSGTIALDGNGQNRISVVGTAGEQFRGIRLTLAPSDGAVGSLEQVRLRGVGVIPEPATWLTMLAGFGALGFAMRRRRNVTVSFA